MSSTATATATATKAEAEADAEPEKGSTRLPWVPCRSQPASMDLRGVGSLGFGGPASGLGLAAHGECSLDGTLWLATTFQMTLGPIPDVNGLDVIGSLLAGLAWRPLAPTVNRPFELGLGLEGGLLLHYLSHPVASRGTDWHRDWKPAAAATVEVGWRVAASWDLFAAGTVETVFGRTHLLVGVDTRAAASVPAFRGLIDGGARLHF